MDIAIIGTGAIGGYYGARLAHAGHAVHFLAHTEYAYLKAHGLKVDSYLGDFSLPPDGLLVYADSADLPAVDLVCITAKATANDAIFPALGRLLKPGGTLLLMQNGFGGEQQLAGLYPEAHVVAGLCFICSFRDGPGHVRHTAYGEVSLGPLTPADRPAADAVAAAFAAAGVAVQVLGDVVTARFRKLVWNIPFNGLSVVLGATTTDLAESPAAQRLLRALMEEIAAAGAACGITVEAEFIDQMMASTGGMDAYNPSMRLDYLAGRPLEIDAIYRHVIAYAKDHGFAMTRAEQLADELEFLQAHR
jgi:2-dehydropantoate 2-reductase